MGHYGNCQKGKGAAIPTSPKANERWSTWDIKDEKGIYFGTVTLKNDKDASRGGSKITIEQFADNAKSGYVIEGLKIRKEPNNPSQWIISLDKIVKANGKGPFPDAPLATPAVYSSDKSKPFILKTKHTDIVDSNGQIITLKGMARPSLEWAVQGERFSEQDLLNMKKWGANTVRLSLKQQYWFDSKSVNEKGSYKQIINAIIYHATQNGMAVILDLHWTTQATQPFMANRDSIKFWQEVAKQYQDYGTVLFELFNEPYDVQAKVWQDGDATYAGYQELYNAVRSTGAQNICVINGLAYGFDLSFIKPNSDDYKIKGTNIVYGSHPYNRSYEEIKTSLIGVRGIYPLLFTEFGDNNKDDYPNGSRPMQYKEAYKNTLAYMKDNNVNYTAWAWWVAPGDPAFPALIGDWETTQPIYGGIFIKQDMKDSPVSALPITSK